MRARILLSLLALANGSIAITDSKQAAAVAAYDQVLAAVRPGQQILMLGDMLVPVATVKLWRDQLAGTVPPASASQTGINKWTGGNVYFAFNGNVSAAHQAATLDAMAEWATFANLHFITRTSETNYVMINDGGTGLSGGNSAVGMIGGVQQLNIGSTSWNRGTLVHELGHALGLIHEHQRGDRDTFVTINFSNVPGGASDPNFILIPTSTNNGAYDFLSVMHYSRKALALNPSIDTLTPKAGYTQFGDIMGNNPDRVLSRGDRDGMAAMYGQGPVVTTVVTATKDSGPGSLRAAIYKAFDIATDTPGATPVITFQIPGSDPNFNGTIFTIQPTDHLPSPGAGTTIDAVTQAAFTGDTNANGPEIVLNGALQTAASPYKPGLRLSTANVTVRGFVINGFDTQGVLITGTSAMGNKVEGCYIGTNAAGTAASANAFAGIEIDGGATGNIIGGTTDAARNVISGNTAQGVFLRDAGTVGNFIEGNYIGLNGTGTAALPNEFSGVEIGLGAGTNTVGGSAAGSGNVISGNTYQGIYVNGTVGNTVAGNFIGTNAAGTAAMANGAAGIELSGGAMNNTIGGTASGAGNVVSGNTAHGVTIADTGSSGNVIAGNRIGTDPAGVAAIPNRYAGVAIYSGAHDNLIGGTSVGSRNVISGNLNQGVLLSSFGTPGTSGNRVQGNYIGTNATGAAAVANGFPGVEVVSGATSNTIGGTAPGAGNVISGNSYRGVTITDAGTESNVVAGNLIGLNAAGTAALPNAGPGILVFNGAANNTIGALNGGRNFICGNASQGLLFIGRGTNGNLVLGNSIGIAPGGGAIGNGDVGIALWADALGSPRANTIGGSVPGASNLISGNTSAGVALFDAGTINNRISGNSITANGGPGIYLDASGANSSQSFPALTSAVLGTATTVNGSLNSTANTAFRVEFFANSSGDPSGFGEGQNYIGATSVTTNGSGNATIAVTLPSIVPAGQKITATATDPAGNTSEFAQNVTVTTTDSDGDGIPDAWMNAKFGHPTGQSGDKSLAADDADGDGMSNAQEFRAGTDPKIPTSILRLGARIVSGNDAVLALPGTTGITYRIDFTDSLVPPTQWRILSDQIPGAGGPITITDVGALGLPSRFYRAVVVP